MNAYFLCFPLIVSITGSITDIRSGKVKNKHLIISIIAWLLSVVFYSLLTHKPAYLINRYTVCNLILSCLLSLVFYLLDIWAPGDIKIFLFIVLSFPFEFYTHKSGNLFPSLDIVIFSFAAGYLYLASASLIKSRNWGGNFYNPLNYWRSKDGFSSLLSSIGFFSATNLLLGSLLPVFYSANRSLLVLICFGVMILLDKKANSLKTILGYIFLFIFIILSMVHRNLGQFLINMFESLILSIIFHEIGRIIGASSYKEIAGEDVRPGMILSFASVLSMQKCIDPNIPRATTENRRSRLNSAQAFAVAQWCKNAKRNVTIVEMLPFVPLLSVGLIIEIIRFYMHPV